MFIIACKLVVHRTLAIVQQKMYSYLTRFKNVAFHVKIFLRTTAKGPPPRCLPQSPNHPIYIHPCWFAVCSIVHL